MAIRFDRIARAQALMREQGMVGIMIMNHDDYRYFFGRDWAQPRAILPFEGQPILIAFAGEEPALRTQMGDTEVKVFTHVGQQMAAVTAAFRDLLAPAQAAGMGEKPKIGMQMWFDTPAFLVDMFRKMNPRFELVASDPVMDALRMVKEPEEVELLTKAQRIAGLGMDRARELLKPGATAHEIATEALCTMMRAGAEGTSTPLHVNIGIDSCMIHGRMSPHPLEEGDLVVIDLTPQVEGYGANLARTFVLGQPDDAQRRLFQAYAEMIEATRDMLKPGAKVRDLDARGGEICEAHGLGAYHLEGIAHGIGLRFEETPASTIIKQHRHVELQQGMTMAVGHTILAIPGFGGVRNEDLYLVTPGGGQILAPYPASIELLTGHARGRPDPIDLHRLFPPIRVEPIRVGIVGCGRISDLHALGYKGREDARIEAVCDIKRARAREKARAWGVDKVVADYQELLADPEIDLVELLVPHHLHAEMTVAACEAGKHVSVQKPMALNVAEADAMIEAAERAGVTLRVYENFVFYPPHVRAKEMIDAGEIGEPQMIRMHMGTGKSETEWKVPLTSWLWRINETKCGGGPLIFDHGYHLFSLARYLMGEVERVYAWMDKSPVGGVVPRQLAEVDAPATIMFQFKSPRRYGVLDFAHTPDTVMDSIYYADDDRLEVIGDRGILFVNRCTAHTVDLPPLMLFRDGKTSEIPVDRCEWHDSFIDCTRHLIAVLRGGGQPVLDGPSGKAVLQFSLAAHISAREGREVRPEEVE